MYKGLTFFGVLILTSFAVSAQKIGETARLITQYRNGIGPIGIEMSATYRVDDISKYKGLPDKCTAFFIRRRMIEPAEILSYYRRNNFIAPGEYGKYAAMLSVDTLAVRTMDVALAPSISIFSGLHTSGKKLVIVDANNNNDFADDEKFLIPIPDTLDFDNYRANLEMPIVTYKMPDIAMANSLNIPKTILLKLNPYEQFFEKYEKEHEDALDVSIEAAGYRAAKFKANGEWYDVYISNGGGSPFFFPFNVTLLVRNAKDSAKLLRDSEYYRIAVNEKVVLNNGLYKFSNVSINGNELFIKYLGKGYDSLKTGNVAPSITMSDVHDNDFDLVDLRGKFVLIDFWGTWCGPCIKALPALRKINSQFGEDLQIVSIASESGFDKAKFLKVVQDNGMSWTNLVVDLFGAGNVAKRYKIQEYPTSFLLDHDGSILYKGTGEAALRQIEQILKKRVKKASN